MQSKKLQNKNQFEKRIRKNAKLKIKIKIKNKNYTHICKYNVQTPNNKNKYELNKTQIKLNNKQNKSKHNDKTQELLDPSIIDGLKEHQLDNSLKINPIFHQCCNRFICSIIKSSLI